MGLIGHRRVEFTLPAYTDVDTAIRGKCPAVLAWRTDAGSPLARAALAGTEAPLEHTVETGVRQFSPGCRRAQRALS